MITALKGVYTGLFGAIERLTNGWFMGLTARLAFSSALMMFFINSAMTKVGSGFPDFLIPTVNAYAQMLPPVAEQAGYNADKIPFFPYALIVYGGTYAEFILPVLILVGLFTRAASAAMIGFIAVMTYVDVNFHGADAKTIGVFFDRVQDSVISDQRLLWCIPLIYLILKGPGMISLDAIFGNFFKEEEI